MIYSTLFIFLLLGNGRINHLPILFIFLPFNLKDFKVHQVLVEKFLKIVPKF